MKTIQMLVISFILSLRGLGDTVPKITCGIMAQDFMSSEELMQPTTAKLMATPEQSPKIQFVSSGYKITFEDSLTGLPVVVSQCAILDARIKYTRVFKDVKTTVLSYRLDSFASESISTNGLALFMTASPTSTTPVSPIFGTYRERMVDQVGAVYCTRMVIYQMLAPPQYRPSLPEETNLIQFSISLVYKHQGVNYLKALTFDDITTSYKVTEFLPQIRLVSVERPSVYSTEECVEGTGEFLHLFRLQWSCDLAQKWQDVDVSPTATANGCRWDVTMLSPAPCRFYRLIQDPKWYPWGGGR